MQVNLFRVEFGNSWLILHLLYDRDDSDSLPVIFFNIDINTLFLFFLYMLIEYVFKIIGVYFFNQLQVEILSLLNWLTVLESEVD